MPRRSNRNALAAAGKNLNLDKEAGASPQPKKSMEDLPPEMVTIILEHLTRNESRNDILGYRRVNSQWKDIIGSLLEKMTMSGHFPTFPTMRIKPRDRNTREDLLYVHHSSTMIPAGRNPFPSNSLLLYGNYNPPVMESRACRGSVRSLSVASSRMQRPSGFTTTNYFPDSVRDIQRMSLADFMGISGGYLTNLALENVVVPGMDSLVTLLRSMSSLKVLRLKNVYFHNQIIKSSLAFPTAPTLPNLTTLEVDHGMTYNSRMSGEEPGRLYAIRHILYVWLIASYSDQLLNLRIETSEQLPALQRGTQYFYSFPDKTTLSIATTSDSAFKNLKELNLHHCHPNLTFIRESELTNLQRISVSYRHFQGSIQGVTNFIGKCKSTLERLRWDVQWHTLKVDQADFEGVLPLSKLKTIEIQYLPWNNRCDDKKISRFLALFPALETLHFLRFHSSMTTPAQELGTVDDDVENADKIVAAKARIASLEQGIYERTMSYYQQRAEIPNRVDNWEELIEELDREMRDFTTATNAEMDVIFEGLAALGVKKQGVLVEQLLEREGIWNTCPNLKLVSVSSGGSPDWDDPCFLRRPVAF